jgi:hypothetical protein
MDLASVGRLCVMLAFVAASGGSAAMPVSAAFGSASLTDISLSVVDLDPNDGIAAGFSFVAGAGTVQRFFQAIDVAGPGGPTVDEQQFRLEGLSSPFIATSGSASVFGARVDGTTSSNGLMISAFTDRAGASSAGSLEFHIQPAGLPAGQGMLLTPRSRLVVTAGFDVSAACGSGGCELASAQAAIQAFGDQFGSRFVDAQSRDGTHTLPSPRERGVFELLLDNLGAATAKLQMVFLVGTSAVRACRR